MLIASQIQFSWNWLIIKGLLYTSIFRPTLRSWAHHLTSLSLSFLSSKIGITIISNLSLRIVIQLNGKGSMKHGINDPEHYQHNISLRFTCGLRSFQGLYTLLSIHPLELYCCLLPIKYHIIFFSEKEMILLDLYWKYIPIT